MYVAECKLNVFCCLVVVLLLSFFPSSNGENQVVQQTLLLKIKVVRLSLFLYVSA